MPYIMSFDAGTTSSRCIIFDEHGSIRATAQREFSQIYPQPGWVEHDPETLFDTIVEVGRAAMANAGIIAADIAGIGIANQRETTLVWDEDGRPVCNAIVWQCRRTSALCDQLRADPGAEFFRSRTGLIIDAYFSATKLKWILENVPGAREKAEEGKLRFGTVDSWLIWRLTGGASHVTDYSNASRTMLFNIHTLKWDSSILDLLKIPPQLLPHVLPSRADFGRCLPEFFGGPIAILGAAGDQQAALFGQTCYNVGNVKNTYGTGGFLLMNTGRSAAVSKQGLLTTIAWGVNGEVSYALEGSVFVAGAVIQWLRDELGIIKHASDTEAIAASVPDTCGCYFVPAFTGLGAPWWNQYARGAIVGLTRGVRAAHIVRAALESIAFQTCDVLKTMEADAGVAISAVNVDGGASANGFLCQFQADIAGTDIIRPENPETTALGAAYLCGLGAGIWENEAQLAAGHRSAAVYHPKMDEPTRRRLLDGWHSAVGQVLVKKD